jgi:hypothetical protein
MKKFETKHDFLTNRLPSRKVRNPAGPVELLVESLLTWVTISLACSQAKPGVPLISPLLLTGHHQLDTVINVQANHRKFLTILEWPIKPSVKTEIPLGIRALRAS